MLYNPFRPHIVKFKDQYALRKLHWFFGFQFYAFPDWGTLIDGTPHYTQLRDSAEELIKDYQEFEQRGHDKPEKPKFVKSL